MWLLLGAYAFLIGLCFGSFALATAWRLKKKKPFGGKERSVCEHCGHVLGVMDLVPLASWFSLRGRCRYCHKKLSRLLPLAELTGGLFLAASYFYWPDHFSGLLSALSFAVWCVGLLLLLILFLYDLQWYILPNKVIHPLWGVGAASLLVRFLQTPTLHTVVMAALAVAVGGGVFYGLYELSKGKWIGFGDVRLGVAIGLFVGTPLFAALVIFTASVLGTLVALPGLARKSRNMQSKLPFGPLLIIALVLVRLFGQKTVDWYSLHFLFM